MSPLIINNSCRTMHKILKTKKQKLQLPKYKNNKNVKKNNTSFKGAFNFCRMFFSKRRKAAFNSMVIILGHDNNDIQKRLP